MTDRHLGIIELLTRVGEERVQLQGLNDAISNARQGKRGVTFITFGTQLLTPGDLISDEQDVFLVVKLPRADVERAKREHAEAVPHV